MFRIAIAFLIGFALAGKLFAQQDDGVVKWKRNRDLLIDAALLELNQNPIPMKELAATRYGKAAKRDHALSQLAVLALLHDDTKSFQPIFECIHSSDVKSETNFSAVERLLEFGELDKSIVLIEKISDPLIRSEAFLKFCYVAGANSTSGVMLALDELESHQPPRGHPFEGQADVDSERSRKTITQKEIDEYRDQAYLNLCLGLVRIDDLNNVEGLIDSISSEASKDLCRLAIIYKNTMTDEPDSKVQSFLDSMKSKRSEAQMLQWLARVRKSRFDDAIKDAKTWMPRQEITIWNEIWRVSKQNSNLSYQKQAASRLFDLYSDKSIDTSVTYVDPVWGWDLKPKLSFVSDIKKTDELFGDSDKLTARELLKRLVSARLTTDGSDYFESINDQKLRFDWVQAMLEHDLQNSNWQKANELIELHAVEFPKLEPKDRNRVFARAAIMSSNWTDALRFAGEISSIETRLHFHAMVIGSSEKLDSVANMKIMEELLEECWQNEKSQLKRPVRTRLEFLIDLAVKLGWPPAVSKTNPMIPFVEKQIKSTKNYESAASQLRTVLGSFTPVAEPTRSEILQLYLQTVDLEVGTQGLIPMVAKRLGLNTSNWRISKYHPFSNVDSPEIKLDLDELNQIADQLEFSGFHERARSGIKTMLIRRFAIVACKQGHVEPALKMINQHSDVAVRIKMTIDCINALPNSPRPEFILPRTFSRFGQQIKSGGLF